jgi:NIMA (never in mitosis gene a)-related kinase
MSLKEFEILKDLGKGAYGNVLLVRRVEDSRIYALKKVSIEKLNPKEQEGCMNEVRLLASFNSINIISYKDAFFDNDINSLCIVMEYADDGDLANKIENNLKNKTFFDEEMIWEYFYQMVKGVKYLHDRKIMHRDLKSANIFMFKGGELKIGDMNVSKVYKLGLNNTQTGTPYYTAPEIWKDLPYDYKCDIWSLGCVLYEMCTNYPPFRGESMQQLFSRIMKGYYDPIPSFYSKELNYMINSLLKLNAMDRPYIEQVMHNIRRLKAEYPFSYTPKNDLKLLKTIKLPKNLKDINLYLPRAKYIRNIKRYHSNNLVHIPIRRIYYPHL